MLRIASLAVLEGALFFGAAQAQGQKPEPSSRPQANSAPSLTGQKGKGQIGDAQVTFEFGADGTLTIRGQVEGDGTWKQENADLTMETGLSTFRGKVREGGATGVRFWKNGKTFDTWSFRLAQNGTGGSEMSPRQSPPVPSSRPQANSAPSLKGQKGKGQIGDARVTFEFAADGTLTITGQVEGSGTWKQENADLTMETGLSTFRGKVSEGGATGVRFWNDGKSYDSWSFRVAKEKALDTVKPLAKERTPDKVKALAKEKAPVKEKALAKEKVLAKEKALEKVKVTSLRDVAGTYTEGLDMCKFILSESGDVTIYGSPAFPAFLPGGKCTGKLTRKEGDNYSLRAQGRDWPVTIVKWKTITIYDDDSRKSTKQAAITFQSSTYERQFTELRGELMPPASGVRSERR